MPQKFAKHPQSFDSFVKLPFKTLVVFENLWAFHRKLCIYVDKFFKSLSKIPNIFGLGCGKRHSVENQMWLTVLKIVKFEIWKLLLNEQNAVQYQFHEKITLFIPLLLTTEGRGKTFSSETTSCERGWSTNQVQRSKGCSKRLENVTFPLAVRLQENRVLCVPWIKNICSSCWVGLPKWLDSYSFSYHWSSRSAKND